MKATLCSDEFELEKDLDILISYDENRPGYANAETLDDLGYGKADVRNTLLSITPQDYSETLPDIKDTTTPAFRVFGKCINKKEIYIKVKIRDKAHGQIFCVSFHYALHQVTKPFAI